MSDLYKEKSALDIASRMESKAHNELVYFEKQAVNQKLQLDDLLKYKAECVDGLKTAKETGLTPLHIRELQLLVKHINSVVETIAHKVDASQKNLEIAKDVWQKKNDYFEIVKEESTKRKKNLKENIDSSSREREEKVEHTGYLGNNAPVTMANNAKSSRKYNR